MRNLNAHLSLLVLSGFLASCLSDAEACRHRSRRCGQSFGALFGPDATPGDSGSDSGIHPDAVIDAGVGGDFDQLALQGNGIDTYVNCDAIDTEFGVSSLTEFSACWRMYKTTSDLGDDAVLSISTTSANNNGIKIEIGNYLNNDIHVELGAGASNAALTDIGAVSINTWQTFCVSASTETDAVIYEVTDGLATDITLTTDQMSAGRNLGTQGASLMANARANQNFVPFIVSEVLFADAELTAGDFAELMGPDGMYDPLLTTWASDITFHSGQGDGTGDSATGTIENRVTGNTCAPTNFDLGDLVNGGDA